MLQRTTPSRMFSGGPDGSLPTDDDTDTAKISVVIIATVFAIQLTFAGIALLFMAR